MFERVFRMYSVNDNNVNVPLTISSIIFLYFKKFFVIVLFTGIGIVLSNQAIAQIWVSEISTGYPIGTYYLGDKINTGSNWYFNFEIGQDTWNSSQVGIGQNSDGTTGWDYADAFWYEDGSGLNKKVRRDVAEFQFTATGTWYAVGRAKANVGDLYTYADEGWNNNTTFTAASASYWTVSILSPPTSQTATQSTASQIDLSWSKWNGRNVMVVRNTTGTFTVPTNGALYSIGNSIGSGTVIYNGSGTSFADTGLDAGQTYYYAFYSENYTYYSASVTASASTKSNFRSKTTGNWSTLTTWEMTSGSIWVNATYIPSSADETITIMPTHTVTVDVNSSAYYLVVDGNLNMTDKTFTIAQNGSITNNSTITSGTSTTVFEGIGTVGGTATTIFNDVTINGSASNGGVDFGAYKSTINGTLKINTWGYANNNAPKYGVKSHLIYNTGAVYDRRVEWGAAGSGTIGITPGYPNDITISGNTTVNYVHEAIGVAKALEGDLIIDAGSSLYMDFGSPDPGITDPLTVNGNITINGNLSLSNKSGGDIIVKGNWARGTGSVFNCNERAVFFTGTTEQYINTFGGEIFDYVVLDNNSNLDLLSNVTVEDELEMISGDITTNTNLLTIGTSVGVPGLLDYTSGSVFGSLRRWFATALNSGDDSGIFPLGVGADFRPAIVEYTSAPIAGGTLTANFYEIPMEWQNSDNSPTIPAVGSCPEFKVDNYSDEGYWQIDAADGLSGGTYTISLYPNGFNIINDVCELTALKKEGLGLWTPRGTHQEPNASGTYGLLVQRTGVTSGWSKWGIAASKNNALPVELTEFWYDCNDYGVVLFWETASEINSDYFEVQKSYDSENWFTITKVSSDEYSNQIKNYTYTDETFNQSAYYRLKQVDIDGAFDYLKTLNVICSKYKQSSVKIYPIPAQNYFTIIFPDNKLWDVKILDLSGKVINSKNSISDNQRIDVSELKSGMYLLYMTNGFEFISMKLVVK